MKRFNYRATEKTSRKTVSGVIQAESEREAGKLLVEQGYIPQKIEEEDKKSLLAKIRLELRIVSFSLDSLRR